MTQTALLGDDFREKIIADPDVILSDLDVMRALIAANERAMGGNVVDLRGIAMERLEQRLDRLEDTHRSVIAAAYENLAGTNAVHRAVLRLLESPDFETFLTDLGGDIAATLQVDCIKLVLETFQEGDDPAVTRMGDVLVTAEPGFIHTYLTYGREVPVRNVTLRQVSPETEVIFGSATGWIRSEACLRLDLGRGRLPGMLVLGAEDPHQFRASHGTDLLAFFGDVFERMMRKWLD
ncbi:DUF484 family protein [Frigidibacter sp. ROC022]|uniref:DUF484 family protein n=1 Tax=Frigidibacter sp. ROC022 TaxID=2971796 RepID=UPI00215AB95F|nr:DUF484 family protein [Frigidibacter sp. ROC022]MCR8725122.1 DUF484 family protein [Frigidibacter sp. ROC022]